MAAIEPLCHLLDISSATISKNEVLLLEIILFLQFELSNLIQHYKIEDDLINPNKESDMLDGKVIKKLLEDILETEEYTLAGMAYHLKIPEELLSDILLGYNQSPSLFLARKIMQLHTIVRKDLYYNVLNILRNCSQKVAND